MHQQPQENTASPAIARIQVHVLRWPVLLPVRTSFGTMLDRPAVLLRIEDSEGAYGWGEAWCNFPQCGAEHRAKLIDTVLAPLLVGRAFTSPAAAWVELTQKTAVLALQAGEPGPMAQAIAGIDIALHDLAARRAGLPLWRRLASLAGVSASASAFAFASASATAPAKHRLLSAPQVPVYASGINPEHPGAVVTALRASGHTAFKLKVGFGEQRDVDNLAAVHAAAGAGAALMVDANQAWDLATAMLMARRLAEWSPRWLEEPLRADRPWHEWQTLAQASTMPLAAGENVYGNEAFDALIAARAIAVVQPDLAKWGGVSGVLGVIDRVAAAGLRYCPHYLGAGIGLLASAHVLAARSNAASWLEVDSNPNPLRTLLCPPLATLRAGMMQLSDGPGLGIEPDLVSLRAICAAA